MLGLIPSRQSWRAALNPATPYRIVVLYIPPCIIYQAFATNESAAAIEYLTLVTVYTDTSQQK